MLPNLVRMGGEDGRRSGVDERKRERVKKTHKKKKKKMKKKNRLGSPGK